jgi:hypothetical protein
MADTRAYSEAERWIREKGLPERFPGQVFEKRELRVGTRRSGDPSYHEFDAVSPDGTIVASINASSGLTTGGKVPVGKTKDAYTELHFLSLVSGAHRFLILTDPEFHKIFSNVSDGRLPSGVEVVHIPLPGEIQERVRVARRGAAVEVSPSRAGEEPSQSRNATRPYAKGRP